MNRSSISCLFLFLQLFKTELLDAMNQCLEEKEQNVVAEDIKFEDVVKSVTC